MTVHPAMTLALTALLAGPGALVIGVAPANAAATPSSITVSACNALTPTATVSTASVAWTSGSDTLSVTNQCSTSGNSMALSIWTVASGASRLVAPFVSNGATATTSALGTDVTAIRIFEQLGGSPGALLATITASSPSSGSGGGTSSDSTSVPAPVVQQFGRPASGTCDAAQPRGLDWAGVASGGWSESWSEWMNGGQGGFVCSRTLAYRTSTASWMVG